MTVLLGALLVTFGFAADVDPGQLLKDSDRSRGSVENGMSWELELVSTGENDGRARTFRVRTKGDNALVESLAPSRYKGEVILLNDRNMWFARPGLRKPVAVSARQKLSGQAANGDIASTQYYRDYTATFVKNETLGKEPVAQLLLKGKTDSVTYDSIRYWISLKQKLALKAEFLNLQGKPFKEATFEYKNSVSDGGKKLPFISRMVITNSLKASEKSVLVYKKPEAAEVSATTFNVNNIVR